PVIERIAYPPAQAGDIVDLVLDGGPLDSSHGRDQAVLEEIRERDVAFDPHEQSRGKDTIVPDLQPAKEHAECVARGSRFWIAKRVACVSPIVAEVTAKIEPCPVIWNRSARR